MATKAMAWLQTGMDARLRWWQWLILCGLCAIILAFPSGSGCDPWWRSC